MYPEIMGKRPKIAKKWSNFQKSLESRRWNGQLSKFWKFSEFPRAGREIPKILQNDDFQICTAALGVLESFSI